MFLGRLGEELVNELDRKILGAFLIGRAAFVVPWAVAYSLIMLSSQLDASEEVPESLLNTGPS